MYNSNSQTEEYPEGLGNYPHDCRRPEAGLAPSIRCRVAAGPEHTASVGDNYTRHTIYQHGLRSSSDSDSDSDLDSVRLTTRIRDAVHKQVICCRVYGSDYTELLVGSRSGWTQSLFLSLSLSPHLYVCTIYVYYIYNTYIISCCSLFLLTTSVLSCIIRYRVDHLKCVLIEITSLIQTNYNQGNIFIDLYNNQ